MPARSIRVRLLLRRIEWGVARGVRSPGLPGSSRIFRSDFAWQRDLGHVAGATRDRRCLRRRFSGQPVRPRRQPEQLHGAGGFHEAARRGRRRPDLGFAVRAAAGRLRRAAGQAEPRRDPALPLQCRPGILRAGFFLRPRTLVGKRNTRLSSKRSSSGKGERAEKFYGITRRGMGGTG